MHQGSNGAMVENSTGKAALGKQHWGSITGKASLGKQNHGNRNHSEHSERKEKRERRSAGRITEVFSKSPHLRFSRGILKLNPYFIRALVRESS